MEDIKAGKLYIVPTPIGNLKDITIRALEVLQNADVIAAEDTRVSIKLLNHYGIKKKLISYQKFNEKDKTEEIVKILSEGKNIALVTDAGMPGISDPGSVVIQKCIDENISFEVLPGPSAVLTALVYSGLDTTKFLFRGFLPRENKDRKAVIDEIKNAKDTIILYEAPHRLISTLEFLLKNLGNREIALCREISKMHEDIKRTDIKTAFEFYKNIDPKGEFVLVIRGKTEEEIEEEKRDKWKDISIEDHIKKYIEDGKSKKDAVKLVAKDRDMPKSEVYKYSINI